MLLILVVVALKLVEVAAAATVTEPGTVRTELEFDTVTLAPPLGAGCVKVTVQAPEEFGPRLPGLHTSEDTSTGATRLTLAVAEVLL